METSENLLHTRYTIDSESIFSRTLEEETIILNLETGQYFSTEHIGTRIWELLQQKHSLREIAQTLSNEFEADENQVVEDLTEFIGELESRGLVQRKD